jgi:hypothetical protein
VPRSFLAPSAALLAAALLAPPALAQDAPKPHVPLQKAIGQVAPARPVPSLYVLNADGAVLAEGRLTLSGVSPNAIVFADRPVRAAGHLTVAQLLKDWGTGADNFAQDPPNATISVLGGTGSEVHDAVVVLSNPAMEGATLTFEVNVLDGAIAATGPAALFIDDRGDGGSGGLDNQQDGYDSDRQPAGEGDAYQGAWYQRGNGGGQGSGCGEYPLPPCN